MSNLHRSRIRGLLAATSLAVALAHAVPALADFSLEGAASPPAASPATPQAAKPATAAPAAPRPLTSAGAAANPAPIKVAEIPSVAKVPTPAAPAPVAVRPAAAAGVVEGFGSGIPLAIALRQIVPAGYEIRYDAGVRNGRAVDWTGGRPWRDVMGATLAQAGYGHRIEDRQVIVTASAGQALAATPSAVAPAAAKAAPTAPASASPAAAPPAAASPAKVQMAAVQALAATAPAVAKAAPVETTAKEGGIKAAALSAASPAPVPAAAPPVAPVGPTAAPVGKVAQAPAAAAHAPRPLAAPAATAAKPTALVPAAPTVTTGSWTVRPGETLYGVLERWSREAGWSKPEWSGDFDYPISTAAGFSGDFVAAVSDLLRNYGDAEPPLRARIFTRNRVVVVNVLGQ
jgi:hypothetical protein